MWIRRILWFLIFGIPLILSYIGGIDLYIERLKDPGWLKTITGYIINYFTGNTPLYIHIATFIIIGLLVFPEYTVYKIKDKFGYKLRIYFDETDPSCIYDKYANYGTNIGKIIYERTIRIRIDNLSKTKAIEGVEVKLTDIDKATLEQKGKLPVRLKLKDDTNNRDPFTIPTDDYKYLDVICAYRQDPRQPICDFGICHIETIYHETPLSFHDVGTDEYKIKIEVKSNTTTCKPKEFKIGLRDDVIIMWEV
ncbi:MAG TPA: hypothetical protein ENI23_05795 [bacterium]|nr:hypothetical protein [bacterium]